MTGSTYDCVGNTCITNSTNQSALDVESSIVTGNDCIVKDATNTAPVMTCDRSASNAQVFGNRLVGANASAPHIKLLHNAYVMNNEMNLTGTGLDLNGNTNLDNSVADSSGNRQITI
jgi:hypothetical protein